MFQKPQLPIWFVIAWSLVFASASLRADTNSPPSPLPKIPSAKTLIDRYYKELGSVGFWQSCSDYFSTRFAEASEIFTTEQRAPAVRLMNELQRSAIQKDPFGLLFESVFAEALGKPCLVGNSLANLGRRVMQQSHQGPVQSQFSGLWGFGTIDTVTSSRFSEGQYELPSFRPGSSPRIVLAAHSAGEDGGEVLREPFYTHHWETVYLLTSPERAKSQPVLDVLKVIRSPKMESGDALLQMRWLVKHGHIQAALVFVKNRHCDLAGTPEAVHFVSEEDSLSSFDPSTVGRVALLWANLIRSVVGVSFGSTGAELPANSSF